MNTLFSPFVWSMFLSFLVTHSFAQIVRTNNDIRIRIEFDANTGGEMNGLSSDKLGLHVSNDHINGIFISEEYDVYIDSSITYLSVGTRGNCINYEEAYCSISARTLDSQQIWSEWSHFERPDHGIDCKDNAAPLSNFASRMIPLNKDAKKIQFRIELLSPSVIVNNVEFFVRISDFKDKANLLESLPSSVCSCPYPSYVTRTGWGCPDGMSSPSWPAVATTVSHLIVHHTVGYNYTPYSQAVEDIWYQHAILNGWGDIGYNWVIAPNGVLYQGRAWNGNNEDVIGAHMCSNNSNKMGVCLIGDFTSTYPTDAALTTLYSLLAWKCCDADIDPLGSGATSSYDGWMDNISGHLEGCSPGYTECPGSNFFNNSSSLDEVAVEVQNFIDACSSSLSEDVYLNFWEIDGSPVAPGGIFTVFGNQCYIGDVVDAVLPSIDLSYYISSNCTLDAGDDLLGSDSSGLGSDDPCNEETEDLIVPADISGGAYYILIEADANSEVEEVDETNNLICIPIIIASNVDSDITLNNWPTNLQGSANTMINVGGEMCYNGNALDADLPSFQLEYYFSTNCTFDASDIYLENDLSGLGSDDLCNNESADILLPSVNAGSYYILIWADAANELEESNEGNNIICIPITVSAGSDLYLSNANTSDSNICDGESLSIDFNLNYTGVVTSANFPNVEIKFYLSTNCNFENGWCGVSPDLELSASMTMNIDSDAPVNSGEISPQIPFDTEAGAYYLLIVADYCNEIYESNETNNVTCVPFTVESSPNAPGPILGSTTICVGSASSYNLSTNSPTATSYTWTLPSGWSGSSSTSSISAIAGSNSGTISVTANNSCGSSTAQILSVNVSSTTSAPGNISGQTSVCPGTTNSFFISPVSGATSYTWTLPSGWSGTSNSASINAISGNVGGTISVIANSACGMSAAQTLSVIVSSQPSTPDFISGVTSVCPSSTYTYNVNAVPGATSYSWALPSGWSGVSNTNSITVQSGNIGGTISVIANSSCGNSSAQTLVVNVSTSIETPSIISGPATVCAGSTNLYTASPVSGATSYSWTLPNGWQGISSTSTINVTAGNTGGTISVVANSNCGSSSVQSLPVVIGTALSTPGVISGESTVCQGSTNTYFINPVSGATSYTWNLPSGWIGNSSATSIEATASNFGGAITVIANSDCGSSSAQSLSINVSSLPNQPGLITGSSTICDGTSNTYNVSPVMGASSYTWTLPSGWSGNSASVSILATANGLGGLVTVTANSNCGSSTPQVLNIMVEPVPSQPTSIIGNVLLCSGTTNSYFTNEVIGASSYTWTLPAGWSGFSTSNSIEVESGNMGGYVSVAASNSCGSSQPVLAEVSVVPGIGSISIIGNSQPNEDAMEVYNVIAMNAVEYTWTTPNNWTINSGQGTASISVTVGSDSGSICVIATDVCDAEDQGCMVIDMTSEVEESHSSTLLNIFPNPASDNVKLEMDVNETTEGSIAVIDMLGQLVHQQLNIVMQSGKNIIELDTSGLANGEYMVIWRSRNQKLTTPLIISH